MTQAHNKPSPQSCERSQQEILEPARIPKGSSSTPAQWTQERQVTFLRALAAMQSVTRAAREVGMTRQSAYKLRTRLKGEPFDKAWDAAVQCGLDLLADAALERALHGVEVPHFYKGELIHTSRKYDERLTVALLNLREQRRPGYIPQSNPASAYKPDGMGGEFGRLLGRIERGPERWD